jgi:protein-S-isoprenylcysteine O-methyltransferase Ste14
MDMIVYGYLGFLLIYRLAEVVSTAKVGALKVARPARDWTVALILVPFFLVVVGPLLEYLYLQIRPGYVSRIAGSLVFIAATFVRTKAHLDLRKGFSMFIEKVKGQQLVETGLYKRIRHPLYLGNLLLFIACPLFLASRISWIFTAMGLAGILIRIRIEERFLIGNMEGYKEYIGRTWAFIPRVF